MKLLVSYSEIPTKPPDWMIKGLIAAKTICGIFGETGGGKTFVGLDLGFSVANEISFHGHEAKKGGVIYIAGEGHGGLKKRLRALEIVHGITLGDNFLISSQPVPLTDPEWLVKLQKAIDERFKPSLIIIDTLARNFGTGDENSTSDMGRFIIALDTLKAKYQCTVLVVHHSGHSQKDRGRGNSSFKAALDHEFKVYRNPDTKVIKFVSTKTKDFEPPEIMAFKLVTTETDILDEEGNYVKSAVLQQVDYTEPEAQPPKPAGKNQKKILDILQELTTKYQENIISSGRDPDKVAVLITDWKDSCFKSGIANNRFYEAKNSLIDLGVITIDEPYVRNRPEMHKESDFRTTPESLPEPTDILPISESDKETGLLSEKTESERIGQESDISDSLLDLDIF